MDLSVRSQNCLRRAGKRTLADLLTMSDGDFAKVRNLGKRGAEEVIAKRDEMAHRIIPYRKAARHEPDLAQVSIHELGLSTRAYNCLWCRAGIKTLAELMEMSEKDLLHVRFLGEATLREITEKRDAAIAGLRQAKEETQQG